MRLTDQILEELTEQYLSLMAGLDVKEAVESHAIKAQVITKWLNREESVRQIVKNVIFAANAQDKLVDFVKCVQSDGFNFELPSDDELIRDSSRSLEPREKIAAEKSEIVSSGLIKAQDYHQNDTAYQIYLKSQVEYIDIRGIGERRGGDAVGFPILDLYTELYVQAGLTNFDLDQGRIRGRKRISLSEMLEVTSRLVIMGDPGSGKTTFLRHAAMKEIIRQENRDQASSLPIFIRLADVYEFSQEHNKELLPGLLVDYLLYISERESLGFERNLLLERFENGDCLWLLDSLDELPSTASRENIVRLLETTCRKWNKCKYVLTSRPIALKGMAIPISFEVVGIDNWSAEEISKFLQAWTSLLYKSWGKAKQRRHWGELLKTILDNHELQSLARNAVMLTAMAVVHYNEKHLPEGKADLLEAVIYWLVRSRIRDTENIQANSKFIEDRYKEIALAMFETEGGRRNRVGRRWAAECIAKHFEKGVEEAINFLEREEETGILIRRGEGDLVFWHLSFQEYLAAKEIAGKTDDEHTGWWNRLRERLDEPEWREVLVLVPACLNRLGGERVDLFFDRLGRLSEKEQPITKAKRVALGGSILRDLKLTGYSPHDAQAWFQVLEKVEPLLFSSKSTLSSVPLETRYEASVAYGLGGDPRLRDFEKTWIFIPGGTILIGAQSKSETANNFDVDAAPWESPVIEVQLNDFEIRKYPITVEEFEKFLADDGYTESSEVYWTNQGWIWKIEQNIDMPLDWEQQLLTPNCPVVGVSWHEAVAYCNWLTRKDIRNYKYRLPGEFEWEYVARKDIPNGQHYPWGNTITYGENSQTNWAGSFLRKCTPVGMFPLAETASGVVDMIGNIEEWCGDTWSPGYSEYPKGMPIQSAIRDQPELCTSFSKDDCRIVRGGSTIRFARLCRPTYRSRIPSGDRYKVVGMRPVRVKEY